MIPQISQINYGIAFIAGVLSFLSPCILALVPAWLGYLSGTKLEELSASHLPTRLKILWHTLLFIIGFSTVFLLIGFSSGAIGTLFLSARSYLPIIAGILIIIIGLGMLEILRIPGLGTGLQFTTRLPGGKLVTSYASGLLFGLGWSPCVGLVLGGIIVLAASSGSVATGASLLGVYSLGLAIPFLILSLLIGSIYTKLATISLWARRIRLASGVLLVIIGFLMASGLLFALNNFLYQLLPRNWVF